MASFVIHITIRCKQSNWVRHNSPSSSLKTHSSSPRAGHGGGTRACLTDFVFARPVSSEYRACIQWRT
jgi:hypothetical protein